MFKNQCPTACAYLPENSSFNLPDVLEDYRNEISIEKIGMSHEMSYLKCFKTIYRKLVNVLSRFKNQWNMNCKGSLEISAPLVSKIDECYKSWYDKSKDFHAEFVNFLQDPLYRQKLSFDLHERKLCSCKRKYVPLKGGVIFYK